MAKEKFELEYLIRTSDSILYNCISTPSGFEEWFADEVTIKGSVFTFNWEGEQRSAEMTSKKKDQFTQFHWLDTGKEKTFFELRIRIDDMTGEVALIVTDFAEPSEMSDTRMLWDGAVENLKRILGS